MNIQNTGSGSTRMGIWAFYGRQMPWLIGLSAVMLGILLWAGVSTERWDVLAVFAMESEFADAAALLAAGEANARGADPYAIPNPFDPYNRPHVYGPGWLALGSLGLTVADTPWVGWLTVVLFLAAVARLFTPVNAASFGMMLCLLLSPPILMGLNRANNDLMIFVLFLVATRLVVSPERWAGWAVAVIIGAATLLKFYPAVAAVALLALPGSPRTQVRRLVYLGLAVALLVGLEWEAYWRPVGLIGSGKSVFAYHAANALELVVGGVPGFRLSTWGGVMLALALALPLVRRGGRGWWELLPTKGPWAFLAVAAAAMWAGCLLAGPSYSYRAVWLLPIVALAWRRRQEAGLGAKPLIAVFAMMLWSAWAKTRINDLFMEEFRSMLDFKWVRPWSMAVGFDQAMVLLTLAICLWMLTGWACRRVREIRAGGARMIPLSAEGMS